MGSRLPKSLQRVCTIREEQNYEGAHETSILTHQASWFPLLGRLVWSISFMISINEILSIILNIKILCNLGYNLRIGFKRAHCHVRGWMSCKTKPALCGDQDYLANSLPRLTAPTLIWRITADIIGTLTLPTGVSSPSKRGYNYMWQGRWPLVKVYSRSKLKRKQFTVKKYENVIKIRGCSSGTTKDIQHYFVVKEKTCEGKKKYRTGWVVQGPEVLLSRINGVFFAKS